ncbi:4-(cytidine 5'-diphospho)-2-C-methyl-D-erythritol kinase [Abyssibacter profundi]|uniref:4-diphosphocytidyl-2-C-methyl-D-erythritol kinase n=1 Tax=Abyssibacter profundi TaxID=2182787 RepID=A0A363UQ31_9GAMM|nr:4-(cytidine 5'-diphospho)-2-C-methyl-D-erythritol kinase [Abyssibacter profundi]PWN57571.1 4-(cytidine 5'-diphospho)-2-C-methyl-D-erythritol kinase [Abyssibacter profundi]
MTEQRWVSPAKLNLCLHINGRYDNGYHALQSVFVPITLCDTIDIRPRDDQRIERLGGLPELPAEDDLALKAARSLSHHMGGHPFGVDLRIDKVIPAGAGLGGGSSNAATVLVALNALWEAGCDHPTLMQLATSLGADVPFFLDASPAWVEGIGEQMTPVTVDDAVFLVVVPAVHISTATVFTHPKLTRNQPLTKMSALSRSGHVSEIVENGVNNCEPVVRELAPEVVQVFEWLEEFGAPRMSGTGSAVFVVLDDVAAAGAALDRLPARWRGWVSQIWSGSRCMAADSG